MTGAREVRGVSPASALTVLELADSPAGEQTGKLLADLGARVVKVEPRGGSASRRTGPYFAGHEGDPNFSLEYWAYNSSKHSRMMTADDATDREVFASLLDSADVVIVEDVSVLADWGNTIDELREGRPDLIIAVITPFGLTGPWADYQTSDLVALAAGGMLNSCGYDDHTIPPIRPGGNQGYQLAASFALNAVMLALIERHGSGRGQLIDLSVHDCNAVSGELANPYWFYPRALVSRQTCRHAQPEPTQPALFECADGSYVYYALMLSEQKAWNALVTWMDELGLAADLVNPEYQDVAYRQAAFSHAQELIEVFFLVQDSETAYHEGQRRGLPIGRLNALEDLVEDEHLKAREFFGELDAPTGSSVLYPGLPYRFSAFETLPGSPPALGEHALAEADHE